MPKPAIRIETKDGVRHLILCRAEEYNTITPQLRDELGAAIDVADTDHEVNVILLRAEGPAFCAGYNLDGEPACRSASRNANGSGIRSPTTTRCRGS